MSFFVELKRRNVFRVAAAYLVFGWLVLQIGDVLFPALHLPEWSITLIAVLLSIGFVAALIVSWVYELTPEGLKRESEVELSTSITRVTGRKLDLITIGMVVLVLALVIIDRFLLDRTNGVPSGPAAAESSQGPDTPVASSGDGTPIVAVLPFKAIGSDDGGFLASGLHDDLLTRLAKLDAFRVISRTSMMEYAETTKNMRQVGEELGAGYILEGGVQAMGERVRINAQLIDAPIDEHLWAETYDRELTAANLFDVQAELATAIADQLKIALSDADREIIDEIPTRNIAAYNAYLRGLDLRDSTGFNQSDLRVVTEAFKEAVTIDPDFALAWAMLSDTQTRLAKLSKDQETEDAALASLARARTLQPGLLEAELAWVAYLYHGLSEYEQALEVLEASGEEARLDSDSLALKSYLYRRIGRFDDAYLTMLAAQKLAPRSVSIVIALVQMAITSDNCDAAKRHLADALSLTADSIRVLTEAAHYELECTGDATRASEWLADADLRSVSGYVLWTARNAAAMQRDFQRAYELTLIPEPGASPALPILDQLLQYDLLIHMGELDRAADKLTAAGEQLAALDRDGTQNQDRRFAQAMAGHSARRGDVEATLRWDEETNRRFRVERKGDRYSLALGRMFSADRLATVGLHKEAIRQLRTMLEEPGGFGFRFVDAWPAFDVLKDHPEYLALRERFADAR